MFLLLNGRPESGRGGHVELLDRITVTIKPHPLNIPLCGEKGMINLVKSVW
jgi:hypothetical protein